MDLNEYKESWYCKPFAVLLMLELTLYLFNGDKYFQLSGFYLPLIAALVFGLFSLIRHSYEKIHFICMALIAVFVISMINSISHLNRGYTLSYLVGMLLLLEMSCMDLSPRTLNQIKNAYILSALLISALIIIFRARYYADESNRLTIQIGSNPLIDPNYLSAYLTVPFVLAFKDILTRKNKVFPIVSALMIAFGILLTGSRGALVSIAIGSICIFFSFVKLTLSKALKIFIPLIALLAVVAFIALPKESLDRLLNIGEWISDPSNVKRFGLWDNAIKAIAKQPLLGYGPQSTSDIVGSVLDIYEPAHNTFFDMCLHSGIAYIAVLSLIIGYILIIKKNKAAKCICLTSLIASIFIGAESSLYLWLNLGLSVSLIRGEEYA